MKTCKDCHKEKPFEDFPKDGVTAHGVQKYRANCRNCHSIYKSKNYKSSKKRAKRRGVVLRRNEIKNITFSKECHEIKQVVQFVTKIKNIEDFNRTTINVLARAAYYRLCLQMIPGITKIATAHSLGYDNASIHHSLKVYAKNSEVKIIIDACFNILEKNLYKVKADTLEVELDKAKRMIEVLQAKIDQDKTSIVLASYIVEELAGLTESQKEGLEFRLNSYIRLCKASNKQNGYFTAKGL